MAEIITSFAMSACACLECSMCSGMFRGVKMVLRGLGPGEGCCRWAVAGGLVVTSPRKTKSSSLRLGIFQDLSLLAYALASCSGITWMTADCSLHYPSPFPTFFSFPVFWSQEQRTPLQDGIAASKEGAGCASAALGARRQRVLGELLPSTGCVATFSFYRCFFLSGIACFLLSLLISFSRYLFSTTTYFLLSLLIFFYR
jgi:hypothetical protein